MFALSKVCPQIRLLAIILTFAMFHFHIPGIDFTDVVVSVRRTKVKLRIWYESICCSDFRNVLVLMLHCSVSRDTAGQERFHTFTKQFFRGAQVGDEKCPIRSLLKSHDVIDQSDLY